MIAQGQSTRQPMLEHQMVRLCLIDCRIAWSRLTQPGASMTAQGQPMWQPMPEHQRVRLCPSACMSA